MVELDLLRAGDPRLEPSTALTTAIAHLEWALLDDDDDCPRRHRDRVLEFLAEHPDVAHRACETGHLTGSAVVVDGSASRTLLLHHRKLGRWFQPGGHADGDTNLAAVALREATEETGIAGLAVTTRAIDVDVHFVEPPGERAHLHLDIRYLVLAPPGAVEVGNEESLALRWLTEAELDHLEPGVDASTRRLVHRGLAAAAPLVRRRLVA